MDEQRVIPQPAGALAWLATQKAKKGGHYTGGEIENFRKGWALRLGSFGKAHHYELYEGVLLSSCGLADCSAGRVFSVTDWPRCKVCARLEQLPETK